MNARVLIVDDEAALRRVLRSSLKASGFAVEEASDGLAALTLLREKPFDLVLLDMNMGEPDGLEVCRRSRGELHFQGGIVMVTVRDSENDKVGALEAGADDFVTKPFRIRELLARLNSVLRRCKASALPPRNVAREGDLEIDFDLRIVRKRGAEIHLTPKEFDVLAMLARAEGAPVTHRKLLATVWGPEYGSELDYLRSYIKMLRVKLEDKPSKPEYILTEPWLGYRFRAEAE